MHSNLPTLRAVAATALVLASAGCLADSSTLESSQAREVQRSQVLGGAGGDEYSFAPRSIQARAGDAIEVKFSNEGREPHTFTLLALRADTGSVAPGETVTITFEAAKKGTFEIVCTIPGHAEAGMTGTLRVS